MHRARPCAVHPPPGRYDMQSRNSFDLPLLIFHLPIIAPSCVGDADVAFLQFRAIYPAHHSVFPFPIFHANN